MCEDRPKSKMTQKHVVGDGFSPKTRGQTIFTLLPCRYSSYVIFFRNLHTKIIQLGPWEPRKVAKNTPWSGYIKVQWAWQCGARFMLGTYGPFGTVQTALRPEENKPSYSVKIHSHQSIYRLEKNNNIDDKTQEKMEGRTFNNAPASNKSRRATCARNVKLNTYATA